MAPVPLLYFFAPTYKWSPTLFNLTVSPNSSPSFSPYINLLEETPIELGRVERGTTLRDKLKIPTHPFLLFVYGEAIAHVFPRSSIVET